MVRFGLLSGHLSGKSCSLGWSCVLTLFCLCVILVSSRFGFEGGFWFLNASVPVHCLFVFLFFIAPVAKSFAAASLEEEVDKFKKKIADLRKAMNEYKDNVRGAI